MSQDNDNVTPPAAEGAATEDTAEKARQYNRERMSELGRKGSRALVKKYGLKFFSEIAARNKGKKKTKKTAPTPEA